MVIAFVGAGSYVFGPSLLQQLLESGLSGVEVRLIDPHLAAIEPLAQAAQAEGKGRFTFSCHSSFHGALQGADFVVHSAAPGMRSMFDRDRQIIAEEAPSHLISEFGGVHGITYSVAQIRFMRELGQAILKECPNAWLFVSANPLTRVTTAARTMGIKVAGFCSVAILAYREVQRLLEGIEEDYPFARAQERYELATSGTNHLSWVVHLRSRSTGEDLLPKLRSHGCHDSPSKSLRMLAETGYLLAPGDDHVRDFLPVDGSEPQLESSSHGSDEEREERLRNTLRVAQGEMPFASLDLHPSWEHPVKAMEALAGGPEFQAVTLTRENEGQIPELPLGAMVETAVTADSRGFRSRLTPLPAGPLEHCLRAVAITESLVAGVLEGDESRLWEAFSLDPTIVDTEGCRRALQRCLASLPVS